MIEYIIPDLVANYPKHALHSLQIKDVIWIPDMGSGISAWCRHNSMVFAQEKVHSKSNEITVIPEILKKLDPKGKIITINALEALGNIVWTVENGKNPNFHNLYFRVITASG
ncbi:MAG: hypothetical protein LBT90_02365 [Holosporaceae bacterium]|nr:hypothetical protein [Holosporaceae bacterium]